jgi:hypothetical protein
MIKFFKIFMNLLYGLFTMGIIAMIVWGANWLVNTGGQSYDVPNLIENEDDDDTRTIYFSDIVSFNMVSIANAHKSHEIFFGNEDTGEEYILWRSVPVGWLNKGMTWTKNVLVATLSPSYEIEQMDRYRHALFVTKLPDTDRYVTIDSSEITVENYTDSQYDVYGIVFGRKLEPLAVGTEFTYEEIVEDGVWWVFKHTPLSDFKFKNEVAKFEKYRGVDYDEFDNFLINKPVAKWAFAEMLIIFALTVFVVYQNPIDFNRNSRGVTEVDRGFLPRIPLPKRRERKLRKR